MFAKGKTREYGVLKPFHRTSSEKMNILKLTGDIVEEFERRYVPVNGHVSPRLAESDHLAAPPTHLPILLCPYKTPRQLPIPNLEQVSRVISDPHCAEGEMKGNG